MAGTRCDRSPIPGIRLKVTFGPSPGSRDKDFEAKAWDAVRGVGPNTPGQPPGISASEPPACVLLFPVLCHKRRADLGRLWVTTRNGNTLYP